mgnify:FL=1
MTAEEILDQYEQARPFYKKGGITVSGGEPLMQIGFVTELFEKAKKRRYPHLPGHLRHYL